MQSTRQKVEKLAEKYFKESPGNSTEITKLIVKNHKEITISVRSIQTYVKDALRGKLNKFLSNQGKDEAKKQKEKEDIISEPIITEIPLSEKLRLRLKHSKNKGLTIIDLSNEFNVGVNKIQEALAILDQVGYNIIIDRNIVQLSEQIQKGEDFILDVKKMTKGYYRFGVTGDNHMGSKYERNDVLNALYKIFEEEGITDVFNTGNWIDGEARFNKHDLKVHGLDNQVMYFLDNFPKIKGITTHLITGDDHEGWYTQREGIDVGKHMQRLAREMGREDLHYLGHMEHDVILKTGKGSTKLRILHPGGGSSYAISYTVQKIVESYQGGEKPDILLAGHYHKAEYNFVRGVHCIQTGTTEDQTPFMRKKKLAAHLGGWIFEFGVDDNGAITRFKTEFIPFYDNKYYKKWNYQMK